MVDSPPPPLKSLYYPLQTCPPNIILRKDSPTKSNADLYKLSKSILLRNNLPLAKLGGGSILFIKNKLNAPQGQV